MTWQPLPKPLNKGEETLALQLKSLGIKFKREFRFCERYWKFDFAMVDQMVAVEIEGGVYTEGRHTRPEGFIKDMEKYNAAAIQGWKVLRYTPEQVKQGLAIRTVEILVNGVDA